MTPASLAQLERAAEKTVECAAAAMLWAGEDPYGVLAHFAGCEAASLAECRYTYVGLCAARQRNSIDAAAFAAEVSKLEAVEFAVLRRGSAVGGGCCAGGAGGSSGGIGRAGQHVGLSGLRVKC